MNIFDAQRKTNGQGVRVRSDGGGDPWASDHRAELGNWFHMQDVDGFAGTFAFARNTADALFMEYVPDDYRNRAKVVRRFAVVALFDRKKSLSSALCPQNALTTAFYLHLCRTIGSQQPVALKFFYVSGEAAPWDLTELDIDNGQIGQRWKLQSGDWKSVWEAAGLLSMRRELEKWLESAA